MQVDVHLKQLEVIMRVVLEAQEPVKAAVSQTLVRGSRCEQVWECADEPLSNTGHRCSDGLWTRPG